MNSTSIFLIIGLLLLSLGPLSYFLTSNPQHLDADYTPPEKPSLTQTYSGEVPATIVDILPFISYVGQSSVNDKDFVDKIVNSVSNNSSVKVSLGNQGYKYEISISLNEIDDTKLIGDKLIDGLSGFMGGLPTIGGQALLPEQFFINGTSLYSQNYTVGVLLKYDVKLNDELTIKCDRFTSSKNGSLFQNPQLCVDVSLISK